MTQIQSNNVQKYDVAIEQYALGQLSPAKHVIISCQRKLSRVVSDRVEIEEAMASSTLDDISIQPLSPAFISNVLEVLPPQTQLEHKFSENDNTPEFDFDAAINNVKWNKFTPIVSVHNIIGSRRLTGAERLYLFRAKAGAKIPEHTHVGEEWVLVLKGSYTVNGKTFKRGDIQIVEVGETHSLEVSGDGECICLAMSQEKIKMLGVVPRIATHVIGI